MKLSYGLKKHQILRRKKEIEELFEKGSALYHYPIKLIYLIKPISDYTHEKVDRFRILILIPKKYIKKSSHRNTVKRMIKESFRLQQHQLQIPSGKIYLLAFIYTERIHQKKEISSLISTSIQHLIQQLNELNA